MKRLLLPLLAVLVILTPGTALAEPSTPQADLDTLFNLKFNTSPADDIIVPKAKADPKPEPPKPQPVVYTVVEGDNLTKIGSAHNVEWQRLWAKNTQLADPDVIHVNDKITVPTPDEVLSRDIPANVALPPATPGVVATAPVYDGSNTYDWGYCTWYVKNRRGASIPNSLGNANTWYSRAHDMGMAVGSVPRAGAVGTTTQGALGHVIYVESVNPDGSINISEMNAPTFGGVTYRTAAASEFLYIY